MNLQTAVRGCAVAVATLGATLMLLLQLCYWAWNGMNLASGAYLLITCAGLAGLLASLGIEDFDPRTRAVFVLAATLALAGLAVFFLVYSLSRKASDTPLINLMGIPFKLSLVCLLTGAGSLAAAAFARWTPASSTRSKGSE